jgi:hypothetical protein
MEEPIPPISLMVSAWTRPSLGFLMASGHPQVWWTAPRWESGLRRLGARGTGGWRRLDVASRMEMAWSGACLATFGSDWLASELIHFWIHLALLFRSF